MIFKIDFSDHFGTRRFVRTSRLNPHKGAYNRPECQVRLSDYLQSSAQN